jgi:hypothetical protein
MRRIELGVAVVAVALSCGVATAQPPVWVGGPVPPGQLYGYSPLVHTIDPFPTKTSGYGPSMFHYRGDRRVYPSLVVNPRRPSRVVEGVHAPRVIIEGADPHRVIIEVVDAPRAAPALLPVAAFGPVGPVVRPLPAQGSHRFRG